MTLTDFILQRKRLIIALGAVILVAELLAFLPFLKAGGGKTINLPETQKKIKLGDAKLLLQTEKASVAVGENFEVSVVLATKSQKAGAVDAVLAFDPTLFQVVAVNEGTIFTEYPQLKFDNTSGEVAVSATTSLDDKEGIEGGEVARVIFSPLKSGQGEIVFLFSPGSTTDSNVVGAGATEDILGEVENLNITIK